MEIRELIGDIVLTIVMVVSTIVLVMRFWQDLIIAVAATFMMLSLGGLLISLGMKIVSLDKSVAQRERTMRVNMEEMGKDNGAPNTTIRSVTSRRSSTGSPGGCTGEPDRHLNGLSPSHDQVAWALLSEISWQTVKRR